MCFQSSRFVYNNNKANTLCHSIKKLLSKCWNIIHGEAPLMIKNEDVELNILACQDVCIIRSEKYK